MSEQQDASQQQWLMQQLLPRRPHGALDAFRIHPEPLGTGAFARVLKATDHQGQAWALKLIQLPSEDSNTAAAPGAGGGDSSAQAGIQAAATSCVQEVQAQLHLSRFPSILPLHAAFRTRLCDPHGARPPLEVAVLQLPLMSCNLMSRLSQGRETIWGGLHTCRPHLSQQEVKSLFLQMVNAVRHCHEGGYSHQDIKAENFLIATDGALLLCDFGLAQPIHTAGHAGMHGQYPAAAHTAKIGGTCWTMSAARLAGHDEGPAADWFSLGVLLYQLHTNGAWPFKAHWQDWERADAAALRATIVRAVQAGHVHFEATCIHPEAQRLILALLEPTAAQRGALACVLTSDWWQDADLRMLAAAHPHLLRDVQQLLHLRHQLLAAAAAAAATAQTSGDGSGQRGAMMAGDQSDSAGSKGSGGSGHSGRSPWTSDLAHGHWPGVFGATVTPEQPLAAPLLQYSQPADATSACAAAAPCYAAAVQPRRMTRLRRILYSVLCLGCFESANRAPRYERL